MKTTEYALTEICNPKQWKTVATKDLCESGYPVYGANGCIGFYREYTHKEKTLMITCRGATCGTLNISEPYSYINGNAMALDDVRGDLVELKFLYYYLLNRGLSDTISGTAQPQITRASLEKVKIDLPDITYQVRVAQMLDKAKVLIDKRKEQIQACGELIKSQFIEMFGTLKDNPNEVDIVRIEDICSMIKDGTHQTPTYTQDTVNGFKFLSSKDVMTQKIDWTDIKYIPPELHDKLYATIKPQRNDILMSKNGVNYGIAAVNDTDEVFDIYVSLALLRPTEVINPVYFRCVLNSLDTKRQFNRSIKGIGVPNLHLGEIKKTRILLPPLSMQDEFAQFVQQVDKLKFGMEKSLKELEDNFDSLMQRAFKGELF